MPSLIKGRLISPCSVFDKHARFAGGERNRIRFNREFMRFEPDTAGPEEPFCAQGGGGQVCAGANASQAASASAAYINAGPPPM